MRIVFFGTPQFAAIILEKLFSHGHQIAAVVTSPDKPIKRSKAPSPSAVKLCALQYDLPLFQPEKASNPEFASFLKELKADVFIVAAYGEILKQNVLEAPKLECINVHGSILPKYRGAAPIQRAIMAGEKETGVSIMRMAKEMDAGDVFLIRKIQIPEDATSGEVMDKLAIEGSEALLEVLDKLEKKQIQPTAQNPKEATFAKKIFSEEGEIQWDYPSETVYNHIRAVTPKPGAWCWIWINNQKKRLNIKKARLAANQEGQAGDIVSENSELVIQCQKGSICLLEVQLEGKKQMSSSDFLRGLASKDLKFRLIPF